MLWEQFFNTLRDASISFTEGFSLRKMCRQNQRNFLSQTCEDILHKRESQCLMVHVIFHARSHLYLISWLNSLFKSLIPSVNASLRPLFPSAVENFLLWHFKMQENLSQKDCQCHDYVRKRFVHLFKFECKVVNFSIITLRVYAIYFRGLLSSRKLKSSIPIFSQHENISGTKDCRSIMESSGISFWMKFRLFSCWNSIEIWRLLVDWKFARKVSRFWKLFVWTDSKVYQSYDFNSWIYETNNNWLECISSFNHSTREFIYSRHIFFITLNISALLKAFKSQSRIESNQLKWKKLPNIIRILKRFHRHLSSYLSNLWPHYITQAITSFFSRSFSEI